MDVAVKVDKELIKKVEELIRKEKYRFSNKKQVVNLAIIEFLKSFSWKEKQNRSIKNTEKLANKEKRGGKWQIKK